MLHPSALPELTAEQTAHSARLVDRIHDDPQVVALGVLGEYDHAEAGHMRVPRPPGEFDGRPFAIGPMAPRLGQHTDEVLHELGVDDATRDDYRRRGVIA